MNEQITKLRDRANKAKHLYMNNEITREDAIAEITPFIDYVNNKSIQIAKKYNQKPKMVKINSFLR